MLSRVPRLGAKALLNSNTLLKTTVICSDAPTICARFVPVESMSVFTPYMLNPIFSREKLDEMFENKEASQYLGVSFKPPLIDDNCSSYYDPLLQKFVNHLMKEGNKKLARTIMEKTFECIKRKQIEKYHLTTDPVEKAAIELDPLVIFRNAVGNCRPVLELSPVRRGGVTYQVPIPVLPNRARFLSIKWLIEAGNDRDGKIRVWEKLAWEFIEASKNEGKVIKRKHDLHKQCEANRAYAHYRWT